MSWRNSLVLLTAFFAARARADEADVPRVAGWLEGTFEKPASGSPGSSGGTRIVSVLVPKSRLGLGAPVLYVETAALATPDRPYRQQFLVVEDAGPGRVIVKVLEPKDRLAVSGKWRDRADLALFGDRDVAERKGCQVTLTKTEGSYDGATIGTGCVSALAGARYVTGRVSVSADRLELANVGFDPTGRRLWGGDPLAFRRVASAVPSPAAAPLPGRAAAPAPSRPAAVAPPARAAPVPEAPAAPDVSSPASGLLVRSPRGASTLALGDLRRLPVTERHLGARYRGASLREVLKAAGVDVSDGKRAALASTVVVAFGADDDTSVVAVDEVFGDGAPVVAYEADGRELPAADGALRLVVPGSQARSIRKLLLLELRELGGGVPAR